MHFSPLSRTDTTSSAARSIEMSEIQKTSAVEGRKLKQSEIDFMKIIEQKNLERVLKLKRTRKNNILTGEARFSQGNFHLF